MPYDPSFSFSEFPAVEFPAVVPSRADRAREIVDRLLERLSENVEDGDAELLSDLSTALWNMASAADCLDDG